MPATNKTVTDVDLPPLQNKSKFAVFFKFGLHNQSTFSIETDTLKELAEAIQDMEGSGLEALVKTSSELRTFTNQYFEPTSTGVDLVKSELGGQVVSETQSGKKCDHGWMAYKTGEKNGKTWAAYMCPLPKGPNQCKPVWV